MKYLLKTLFLFSSPKVAISGMFFLIVLIGCKDGKGKSDVGKTLNRMENDDLSKSNLAKKIDLYPYDTIFNQFLPDTSLVFYSNKPLKEYLFEKYRVFDSVFNNWESKDSIQTFVKKRTAQILYDDYAQAIKFKYFKTRKDNLSLAILSDYSPYSRIITVEDRLEEFNNYSKEMQLSQIGSKTIEVLKRYDFKDNMEKSLNWLYDEKIMTPDGKQTLLKELLDEKANYYILVFGASWCGACIIEERMLKYWSKDIQAPKIQIVGISVDDNINKWKKYINSENYPWKTVLLADASANKVSKRLNLGNIGIPMNFLIDSNNNVLAKNTDIRKILEYISELTIKNKE